MSATLRERAEHAARYGKNLFIPASDIVELLDDKRDAHTGRNHWENAYSKANRDRAKALNRAASETARANTWRERAHGNVHRVHRAARAIRDARTERDEAFTALAQVRGICDKAMAVKVQGSTEGDAAMAAVAATILRALDTPATDTKNETPE